MKTSRFFTGAALAVALAASPAARAAVAFNLTGGTVKSDYPGTIGTDFTVGANPLTVTSLGYYNGAGFQGTTGGVPTSHQVGIYNDATQVLVGSATVTYDGTAAGPNSFIYVPVASFTLAANTKYDIVGSNVSGSSTTTGNANYLINGTGVVSSPDLVLGHARYAGNTAAIVYPSNTFAANDFGNIGANFQYSVPEPASLGLLALSAVGVLARRRRRTS